MNKEIFTRMNGWSQLFFLVLFVFAGIVLLSLVMAIAGGGSLEKMQSIDFLRIMQFFQAVFLFLVPACICAYLFHEHFSSYLKINKSIDWRFLSLVLLLMLIVQPFISFLGYYNNLITLPESLSGVEQWMRAMEDTSQALMERFLVTDSISILFLNIFIIAIMAGITEEFFFRGSLQQIIDKISKNKHVAVWVTAFVFSAIHFQFYGFFPRLLLGAILGYIFLWSGSLWISVIAHAFNNLIGILLFYFMYGTPQYEEAENFGGSPSSIVIAGVSIALSGVIIFLLFKEYEKNKIKDAII